MEGSRPTLTGLHNWLIYLMISKTWSCKWSPNLFLYKFKIKTKEVPGNWVTEGQTTTCFLRDFWTTTQAKKNLLPLFLSFSHKLKRVWWSSSTLPLLISSRSAFVFTPSSFLFVGWSSNSLIDRSFHIIRRTRTRPRRAAENSRFFEFSTEILRVTLREKLSHPKISKNTTQQHHGYYHSRSGCSTSFCQ